MITPDTMIQAIPVCTLKARAIRVIPETTRRMPRVKVSSAAASSGLSKVTIPAMT